jgi:hypothetical protein
MRKLFTNFILSMHLAISLFWFSLFLVPLGWWSGKISFQFFLGLIIFGHQVIWGATIYPWTKKYQMVCFLTTIAQILQGKKISDPKNYGHSFTSELFNKIGLNFSHRILTILGFIVLTTISVQYFFFNS